MRVSEVYSRSVAGPRILPLLVDERLAVDIDTELDLHVAEVLAQEIDCVRPAKPLILSAEPIMDVPRKDAAKKRLIKRIIIGLIIIVALLPVGYYVGIPFVFKGRLKPAAPGVELSTLWPDTVRRGPMVLEVHGLGTLIPEDTLLIPAQTDGRIEKILIKPGTPVKPDSIILIMTNQELQTALLDPQFTRKPAKPAYPALRVPREKQGLALQANAAQVSADFHSAQLKAERDDALDRKSTRLNSSHLGIS